jgi:RNA-directed DNA polymerase
MKDSYDEDLANHIGPESCVYWREVVHEALTGERAGWVLSREKGYEPGCRRRQRARKAKRNGSLLRETFRPREVVDPMHVRKLFAREPGDPTFGLAGMATRSARRIPREHCRDEQTWEVGQGNSTEEAAEQRRERIRPAEAVEGRSLTKGNLFQQNKYWTQNQERSGRGGHDR